jgi:hypothetical protein
MDETIIAFDLDEPQFTQREAAQITGAPMGTINNWLDREYLSLGKSPDRRLRARRMFSGRDIIFVRAMFYCTSRFGLPPAHAAGMAHRIAADSSMGLPDNDQGEQMSTWYLLFRVLDPSGNVSDEWGCDHVAFCKATGRFFDFNDASLQPVNPVEIAGGFLAIPSSIIAQHTIAECADLLSQALGNPPGTMTRNLPPMRF